MRKLKKNVDGEELIGGNFGGVFIQKKLCDVNSGDIEIMENAGGKEFLNRFFEKIENVVINTEGVVENVVNENEGVNGIKKNPKKTRNDE